jgi:hypothetical protein
MVGERTQKRAEMDLKQEEKTIILLSNAFAKIVYTPSFFLSPSPRLVCHAIARPRAKTELLLIYFFNELRFSFCAFPFIRFIQIMCEK